MRRNGRYLHIRYIDPWLLARWVEDRARAADEEDPASVEKRERRQRDVQTAVGNLPERQKQVVIAHYYLEMSQREIADDLRTSLRNVWQRLRAAKRNLRRMLEDRGFPALS